MRTAGPNFTAHSVLVPGFGSADSIFMCPIDSWTWGFGDFFGRKSIFHQHTHFSAVQFFVCSRFHFCWKPINKKLARHTPHPVYPSVIFSSPETLLLALSPCAFVTKGPTMKLCDFGQSGPPGDAWSVWEIQAFHRKIWEIPWKSLRNGCFQCPKLSKCFLLKRNSSRKSLYINIYDKYMGMDQCRKNMEKKHAILRGWTSTCQLFGVQGFDLSPLKYS